MANPRVQFLLILLLAFALRWATFGDPALDTDEEFYFLVGQKLLDGQIPYVDIWDRKPLGLFLLYAGFGAVGRSAIVYQVGATIAVGATAFLIARVAALYARWQAQLCAAFFYIALLPLLGGFGGQAAIFHNLPIAAAVLIVAQALTDLAEGKIGWRIYVAMALCGLALTIKPTVVFECAFLGLFVLSAAWKGGMRTGRLIGFAAVAILLGILPTMAIALGYAVTGHWPEYYQAVVASNFAKETYPDFAKFWKAVAILSNIWLPLSLGIAGLLIQPPSRLRFLLAGWLIAATADVAIVPNFYLHYALAMLPPIACCSALLFEKRPFTMAIGLLFGLISLYLTRSFDFSSHRQARASFEQLSDSIARHSPRGTLLVYDGPVYLYATTGMKPLSKLVLPWHLKERIEFNASGLNVARETRRILAARPGAVTMLDAEVNSRWQNLAERRLVERYVRERCRRIDRVITWEWRRPQAIIVYGDCQ
jgi:hypothetical protein